jgi:peptidoglycan/xylan/chitin deacetylase (PgdA/CDA1 family)
MVTWVLTALLSALVLVGCDQRRIADSDSAFYAWDDRRVLCGASIDDRGGNDFDNLREAMERAAATGEVLVLYGHKPGADFTAEFVEQLLAEAVALGLTPLSFAELAAPDTAPRSGLALTFDDAFISQWYDLRTVFARHDAHATFFVTRFYQLRTADLDRLRELRADGHAIELHGHNHLNAPEYVEEHGLAAYLADEVVPAISAMQAKGFEPTSFAYPFGQRTGRLDRALLKHVRLLRALSWTYPVPLLHDGCPH